MPRTFIAWAALAALLLPSARAQHVAIVNAVVDGHEGPVTIVVRGGKIRSVGPLRRPPRDLPQVDAKGGRVVPGRIDAWAVVDGSSPVGDARDGFDPFDPQVREALAQGVTSLCLVPVAQARGACGAAALIKLRPGQRVDVATVASEVAVCAGLGGVDDGPLEHAARLGALEDALEEAGRYREEWAAYEDALAEWLQKQGIKEGGATPAAVDSRGATAPVDTRGGVAPVGTPGEGRPRRVPGQGRGRRPRPPEPTPDPGQAPEDDAQETAGVGAEGWLFGFHVEDDPTEPPPTPPRPRRGRRGGEGPAPEAPGGDGAAEGQQGPPRPGEPPRRPRVDRAKALLARVVARELPLMLQVERAEDVLGALELQDRLHLRLILTGLREGHLVGDALRGRADLALVLGPQAEGAPPGGAAPAWPAGEGAGRRDDPWSARRPLRASAAGAARLAGLGLPFAIGSGDLAASRFVELNAAVAGSGGLSRAGVEAALTSGPAGILGVRRRLGVIAPDADADLVVLAPADPARLGAPPAPVLVLIEGQTAWRAQ